MLGQKIVSNPEGIINRDYKILLELEIKVNVASKTIHIRRYV